MSMAKILRCLWNDYQVHQVPAFNDCSHEVMSEGLAEPASQYTWIFTSILSSDMLLRIEQLLSRTKFQILAGDWKLYYFLLVRITTRSIKLVID